MLCSIDRTPIARIKMLNEKTGSDVLVAHAEFRCLSSPSTNSKPDSFPGEFRCGITVARM